MKNIPGDKPHPLVKKKTERESHTQKIHCFEGKLRKAKHDSSLTCSVWSYEPKLHF